MVDRQTSDLTVLLAEDEPVARSALREQLENCGVQVEEAYDGAQAIDLIKRKEFVAAYIDLEMPRVSGLGCLEFTREYRSELSIVIVSAVGKINDAVAAMKLGAVDYLTKPCEFDSVQNSLRHAMRATRLAKENSDLKEAILSPRRETNYIAHSPATKELLSYVDRAADLDLTVLLTGPSGSGKTLLARRIHENSRRGSHPFVTVNCSSLPRDLIETELFGHVRGAFTGASHDRPGRVEVANGGTLFLDEIGDLPLELQPKLLTFLQDREFQRIGSNEVQRIDVRLVAATNRDLHSLCEEGLFREDLYYRLDVISLGVPALKHRTEDILPLCTMVLEKIAARNQLPPYELANDALRALQRAEWPGNVRQLENCLERACAFCQQGVVQLSDLRLTSFGEQKMPAKLSDHELTLEEIELAAIKNMLTLTAGNRAEAARRLGVSDKTIYNKLQRYPELAEAFD